MRKYTSASAGTYSWLFPTTLANGTDYKFRVSKYGDNTIYDESDNYFKIAATVASLNSQQDALASISAAIAKLAAEIQAMSNNK